jgi:hypothetical protein
MVQSIMDDGKVERIIIERHVLNVLIAPGERLELRTTGTHVQVRDSNVAEVQVIENISIYHAPTGNEYPHVRE